jgi:hypothetical protein
MSVRHGAGLATRDLTISVNPGFAIRGEVIGLSGVAVELHQAFTV